jgi:hypothetical protein
MPSVQSPWSAQRDEVSFSSAHSALQHRVLESEAHAPSTQATRAERRGPKAPRKLGLVQPRQAPYSQQGLGNTAASRFLPEQAHGSQLSFVFSRGCSSFLPPFVHCGQALAAFARFRTRFSFLLLPLPKTRRLLVLIVLVGLVACARGTITHPV